MGGKLNIRIASQAPIRQGGAARLENEPSDSRPTGASALGRRHPVGLPGGFHMPISRTLFFEGSCGVKE